MITHSDNNAGWDYFISYTKSDRQWAEWIGWALEQNGHTCFAQFADIPPGSDFIQEMNEGLRRSRQIIAVLSPEYLTSPFATSELNAALGSDPIGRRRRLIPVRVRPCESEGILATRVYIDLVGKQPDDAARSLIQGIAAAGIGLAASASTSSFEKPPPFPGQDQLAPAPPRHFPDSEVVKILFIASERGTDLNLKGQVAEVKKALRSVIRSGLVMLDARYDVLAEDLADVVNEVSPNVVHFSGKQNAQRILVPSASGGVTTISSVALTGLFRNLADTVRLVIVDTCRSLQSAKELSSAVDYAIGVEGDIYDEDATAFYTHFYRSLSMGLPLDKSVGQAASKLQMRRVKRNEIPALCSRTGVSPRDFTLIEAHRNIPETRASKRRRSGATRVGSRTASRGR